MLNQLLKTIAPNQIAQVVKENPFLTISVLQNFKTFQSLATAMTVDQQIVISNNLQLLEPFLSSTEGRDSISIFADEFVKYVKSSVELHNTL